MGIYRQKLTKSSKNDLRLRFGGPRVAFVVHRVVNGIADFGFRCSPFYGRACRWAMLGELKPEGPQGDYCPVPAGWQHPKPQTPNPKPQTPNPKPGYHRTREHEPARAPCKGPHKRHYTFHRISTGRTMETKSIRFTMCVKSLSADIVCEFARLKGQHPS